MNFSMNQGDDADVLELIVEGWFGAFENKDWQALDAEFGSEVTIVVPTGKGNLRQVMTWSELGPEWRHLLAELGSFEFRITVNGNEASVCLRRGQESLWSDPAFVLQKRYWRSRLTQMELANLDLLI